MVDSATTRPSGIVPRRRIATHVGAPWLCHCDPSAVGARHPRIRRQDGHAAVNSTI
jgi:hypothetical protein